VDVGGAFINIYDLSITLKSTLSLTPPFFVFVYKYIFIGIYEESKALFLLKKL
jgi:hypothetical protein